MALVDQISTTLTGLDIWSASLDDDATIDLDIALRSLNLVERSRADRFVYDRDRHRFVRGRGFLRQVLAGYLDCPAKDVAFTEIGNGKPALASGPYFNLSHSRDRAVLAVSTDRPVGIDLEFNDRRLASQGIAQSCFTESECAVLNIVSGVAWNQRFFAFWTAKEARMKLTGEGLSLAPKSIELELEDGWPIGIKHPSQPKCEVRFLDISPEVTCCIVS
ncbi:MULTISPECIES: 4'-phosphopantetheinyl transferase superfamily protein [unclassified Ruegeria]|uniref:4'-phosphopantetheinyl transferase family protein n=1 Tax=unclassified Ruegeria TaxID=2625375 RepID=UPI0014893A54|nr:MULTISPECIES: 4'-phosphopantetheinyl transferase superfamily protein [unclassified Ruegeria]